jgi:hypothetical protein
VLYYSTRCRYCQAFLEELRRTPELIPEFQFQCVDPSPSRGPLPSWLKTVPSMIPAGSRDPLIGPGAVNNWLFERKMSGGPPRGSMTAFEDRVTPIAAPVYSPDMAPRADASRGRAPAPAIAPSGGSNGRLPDAIDAHTAVKPGTAPPPSAMMAPNTSGEPMAYHGSEMGAGKWSDNYSFVNDAFTSDKGMNRIERNFASLLPTGMFDKPVAATTAPAHKASAKEEALLADFERYAAARDRDIAPAPQRR